MAGITAFERREARGPVYFEALQKVGAGWGRAEPMAGAVWLLLKSWHRQFYRFGPVDLMALARCIEESMPDLDRLRLREIETFCRADESTVAALFRAFTIGTRRKNAGGYQESTVATAKALHILSPGFLPLWDNPIAWRYGYSLMWSEDYISFCWLTKGLATAVRTYVGPRDDRTVLKRIGEFNYASYSKPWNPTGLPDPATAL